MTQTTEPEETAPLVQRSSTQTGSISTTVGSPTSISGPEKSVVSPSTSTAPSSVTTVASISVSTTSSEPMTTETESTRAANGSSDPYQAKQLVALRFESQVSDVSAIELETTALAILNDDRGWGKAGFSFVSDERSEFRVVLAEGSEVDQLCLPLMTYGKVSCQNGAVVALNADRWRDAVPHWTLGTETYRGYLVNHEVGHLLGQRHPKPRCPILGRPAGVMEQQTAGLEGCIGNPWPRDWELALAEVRPVVYAPLPDWAPEPVPTNREQ